MEEYQHKLDAAKRELQQFAYAASHDLKEPLRMVSSYLDLLERRYGGQLDANANEFITFARDGATWMQELVDGLLRYSRVETEGHAFEWADANMALDRAIANLKVSSGENNAIITRDPLPEVEADPVQLVQVFQNLISNALKFHPPGRSPHVHVSAAATGTECVFSVRDDGIGIDPADHDRIFELFQRLNPREAYPGTGVGLSIVRRIVERHGVRAWVESELGKGATFYFALPRRGE